MFLFFNNNYELYYIDYNTHIDYDFHTRDFYNLIKCKIFVLCVIDTINMLFFWKAENNYYNNIIGLKKLRDIYDGWGHLNLRDFSILMHKDFHDILMRVMIYEHYDFFNTLSKVHLYTVNRPNSVISDFIFEDFTDNICNCFNSIEESYKKERKLNNLFYLMTHIGCVIGLIALSYYDLDINVD